MNLSTSKLTAFYFPRAGQNDTRTMFTTGSVLVIVDFIITKRALCISQAVKLYSFTYTRQQGEEFTGGEDIINEYWTGNIPINSSLQEANPH